MRGLFKKAAAVILISLAGCLSAGFTASAAVTYINEADINIKWSSYTYTGSHIKVDDRAGVDDVTVTLYGETLQKGKDYSIYYSNNKEVGTAKMTVVSYGGKCIGAVERSFVIKPEKNVITEISADRKSNGRFTVSWEKGTEGTVGYQVLYSQNKSALKNASNAVDDDDPKKKVYSWIQKDVSDTSENFSKIPQKGETWYVKIRSFYTKDGKTTSTKYGTYSDIADIHIPANKTEDDLLLYCPYITQYRTERNSKGYFPYNSEGFSAKKGCGPVSLLMVLQGEKNRTDISKVRIITDQFSHGWFYNGWAGASPDKVDFYGCTLYHLRNLASCYGYVPNVDYEVEAKTVSGVNTIPDIDKCLEQGHLVLFGQAGSTSGKRGSEHFMVIYGREYDYKTKENVYLIANPAHIDSDSGVVQTNLKWGSKLLVHNMDYASKVLVRGIIWLS